MRHPPWQSIWDNFVSIGPRSWSAQPSSLAFYQTWTCSQNHWYIWNFERWEIAGIISGFEDESSIPRIMPVINGTHISLCEWLDYDYYWSTDYWCCKGFHSFVLKGICDDRKIFWSLACHILGSQVDSTHLKMSRVSDYLNDEAWWVHAPRLQFAVWLEYETIIFNLLI